MFVIYFCEKYNLVFIHSTDKATLHKGLASKISNGTANIISGEQSVRVLGKVNRLMFQNVGLKKPGRRNLSFSMYSGTDVAQALSPAQTSSSTRTHIAGSGFSEGRKITIGWSNKGRCWSKKAGPIRDFTAWCTGVGEKNN